MKKILLLLAASLLSGFVIAQTAKVDAHTQEDIAKHRAMAAAHEAAAKCLESGKKESACHAELKKACSGIALGKICGMKHH